MPIKSTIDLMEWAKGHDVQITITNEPLLKSVGLQVDVRSTEGGSFEINRYESRVPYQTNLAWHLTKALFGLFDRVQEKEPKTDAKGQEEESQEEGQEGTSASAP